MTRTAAKAEAIRAMGGSPAVADALDPEAVAQAVAQAEPDAVIHELTAIDLSSLGRSIDKTFARTNRLRTEGTDHLLAAARLRAPGGSSPRASRAGPTSGSAARSRQRMTRSTTRLRSPSQRRWQRSGISRAR